MGKRSIEKIFIFMKDMKAKIYTALLSFSLYEIGEKTTIIPPMRFGNLHSIKLGKYVTIHGNCWIQVLSGGKKDEPKIIINDYASIGMNATVSAALKIVIGENVFFGRNVYISDHGHEFKAVDRPIGRQGIRKVAEVKVGKNSWLGQNSVILPGVQIGEHCVIGANSVVNRNIPDYCVAAGNPAKIIQRFNKETGSWEEIANNE